MRDGLQASARKVWRKDEVVGVTWSNDATWVPRFFVLSCSSLSYILHSMYCMTTVCTCPVLYHTAYAEQYCATVQY